MTLETIWNDFVEEHKDELKTAFKKALWWKTPLVDDWEMVALEVGNSIRVVVDITKAENEYFAYPCFCGETLTQLDPLKITEEELNA